MKAHNESLLSRIENNLLIDHSKFWKFHLTYIYIVRGPSNTANHLITHLNSNNSGNQIIRNRNKRWLGRKGIEDISNLANQSGLKGKSKKFYNLRQIYSNYHSQIYF